MSFKFGNLEFKPALENTHLVPETVKTFLEKWPLAKEVLVAEVDPDFTDSAAFCEKYNILPTQGANCLIIEVKRAGLSSYAVCLVPIAARANLNNVVRKFLNAKGISMASRDFAVERSQMEFGSITVLGLPSDWQILIDEKLLSVPNLVIGGGLRKSKLLIRGKLLSELPNAQIVPGLT